MPRANLWVNVPLFAFAALIVTLNSAAANPYDKCTLDHAATINDSSSEAIDAIAEACIKSSEEPIDPAEAAKVKLSFLYGKWSGAWATWV